MSLPEQKNSPEIKPQISPEKLVDFDVKKETADVKKEIIDTKLSNIQEKQELFKESQNKMI
jgi:FKBP-type peptidyl-prolyl cis-trans isomerase (trigger factor)